MLSLPLALADIISRRSAMLETLIWAETERGGDAGGPDLSPKILRNSYTMVCLPVRGDNPRALASGLSYVQVDKHGITILYHLHLCRPCTSRDISC